MTKFKVGDRLEAVEMLKECPLGVSKMVAVVTGILPCEYCVYPIQIEWVKHYEEISGKEDRLNKDGWLYNHATTCNARFAVVKEFEGNI